MAGTIDALTSATLKHLREAWWDDTFTEFLAETLGPKPGNRILDVGCGEGLAEVAIGRLHISQLRLVGIDLGALEGRGRTSGNHRPQPASGVRRGRRVSSSVQGRGVRFDLLRRGAAAHRRGRYGRREFARVTAPRGRVLAVEPDNSARYGFSSTPMGRRAFELSAQFFIALAGGRGDRSAIGPNLPAMFARHGIEPLSVRLFPVSQTWLGPPDASDWQARRAAVEASLRSPVRRRGLAWPRVSRRADLLRARSQRRGIVVRRDSNTMLFATVGQNAAEALQRRPEGHEGWDDYAPFYDWENARTLGRAMCPSGGISRCRRAAGSRTGVRHGQNLAAARQGRRAARRHRSIGAHAGAARTRTRRARLSKTIKLIRGDIRFTPFAAPAFSMVMAPYGILQSLLRERDLTATLQEVRRVLEPGGTFGIELVADLPSWEEYQKRLSLKGWRRQTRRRARHARRDRPAGPRAALTIFNQEFTERRGTTAACTDSH